MTSTSTYRSPFFHEHLPIYLFHYKGIFKQSTYITTKNETDVMTYIHWSAETQTRNVHLDKTRSALKMMLLYAMSLTVGKPTIR